MLLVTANIGRFQNLSYNEVLFGKRAFDSYFFTHGSRTTLLLVPSLYLATLKLTSRPSKLTQLHSDWFCQAQFQLANAKAIEMS
jgi:hypothetical protein